MAALHPSSIQRRLSGHASPPASRGEAMCPFCLASMGLIVAGGTSAGGLTDLAVKLARKKNNAKEIPSPNSNERSNEDESSNEKVNQNSREHQNRVADAQTTGANRPPRLPQ